jgi:hypothetical protein
MKIFASVLIVLMLGGTAFWLPVVVLFPLSASEKTWMLVASFIPPLALFAFCRVACWYVRHKVAGPSMCLFSLIGVWLTGPWFMTLAAALRKPEILKTSSYAFLSVMSVLPYWTLYMSLMEGSGYGLLIATLLLPFLRYWWERESWLIPLSLKGEIGAASHSFARSR